MCVCVFVCVCVCVCVCATHGKGWLWRVEGVTPRLLGLLGCLLLLFTCDSATPFFVSTAHCVCCVSLSLRCGLTSWGTAGVHRCS